MSYRIVRRDGVFGALGTTEQECLAVGGKFQWDPAGNMCQLPPVSPSWLLPVVISASAIGVIAVILCLDKPKRLSANKLSAEQQKKFDALRAKYHEAKAYTYSYCPECDREEKHQVLPKQYGEQQKLLCLECGRAHKEESAYIELSRPRDLGLSPVPKAPRSTTSAKAIERAVLQYEGYQLPESAPRKFWQKPLAEEVLGKGIAVQFVGQIPRYMSKKEFMSLLTIREMSAAEQEVAWKKFKTRPRPPVKKRKKK